MSFWPFGQSISSSNINKILEEYFSVLHSLEKTNPNVARSVRQSLHGAQETMQRSGAEFVDSIDEEPQEELLESAEPIQQKNDSDLSSGSSSSSSSSSLSSSKSSSSETGLDDDEIQNSTAPLVSDTTISSLNSSFINRLLNESELLNELTRQNSNLLDFICFGFFYEEKTQNKVPFLEYLIDQLMDCINKISPLTTSLADVLDVESTPSPPPTSEMEGSNGSIGDDNADETNNKEPNYLSRATIISEIFSLDIWLITESLVNNQSYLSKIWSILNHPNLKSERSPLVPIFLKINQNFLVTRQDQYLNFVRLRTNLVDDMLQHISISMLMDFFLKCIATDKFESPTGLIELVNDQRLIPKCLNFLNNDAYSSDIQACAGDFLKALIAISANAPLDDMSIGPNALTRQLASQESIDQLVDIIINRRGSALNTTVSIVIELIRKNNSDYDQVNLLTTTIQSHPPSNHDPIYLGYLLKTFSRYLPTLFQIIIDAENDSNNPILENQLHEKFRPLGFERFKIVELVAELLHCSNMGLMNSKRAERIVKERDHFRKHMVNQLQDAIQDLTIAPKDSPNDTITSSTSNRHSSKSRKDSKSDKIYSDGKHGKSNTNFKDRRQKHRQKERQKHQRQQYTHDDNDDDDDRFKAYDNDEGNDNKATKAVSPTTTTTTTTNDDSITTNGYDAGVTKDKDNENASNNDNATTNNNNKNNNNDNDNDDNDDNNNISDNIINNEFDEEDDEVDESFEIPYVNLNQSEKLRKKPTIGDFFKIQLYDIQFLPKIIELFLTHPWNNFWHNVIFDIIQQIFNGRMDFSYNSFLVYSLFNLRGSLQFMPKELQKPDLRDFTLTKDFILQGYQDSYHFYEKYHTNLGYMGHLVLIAEEVVKFSKLYKVELISPDIHEALQDEEWRFYSEDVLNDTRMMYSKILGGGNYVDDGHGNIIPQLPDPSLPPTEGENLTAGGELINVESLEEQLGLSTESDLHDKLRELLIASSQKDIDSRNERNGVILLGPPSQDSNDNTADDDDDDDK
ncbi:hypothetical protein ZYGR_0AN01070 [Zygosaccharomyces rouxii]|uniref:Uncharacterized protein n=1 Tax=Zygosaccharomyces rouxii TaxID=4956 RepID=A0A1Q3AFU4_ZYGRO|nr:hypothetical protein ZYGR_0AN01070 [Zygosaccharomyces rouxii]